MKQKKQSDTTETVLIVSQQLTPKMKRNETQGTITGQLSIFCGTEMANLIADFGRSNLIKWLAGFFYKVLQNGQ
jgi:hypothetical protein